MVERGPRPHRQRISDEALLKIIEKNPFLEEGAKEAGLSPSGFSERAKKLGWNPKDRRRLIVGYLVELRTWVRSQPQVPTVEEIHQHHVGSLRTGTTDLFRRFNRYWSCLEKTLREDPRNIDVLRTSRNGWLAIQLAWKVLKRAHSASTRKTGAPKKSKTNPAAFREEVENTLGRFDKAFAVLAEAKKSLSSSSWAGELRKSGFSDRETFAILASRKPKDAAIRCASERNHIAFKTGQNYYSQESASAK